MAIKPNKEPSASFRTEVRNDIPEITEEEKTFFTTMIGESLSCYPLPQIIVGASDHGVYFPVYRDQIFVDLGANVGGLTYIASQIYQRVIAVEPVVANLRFLEKVISLENVNNVEVIEAAVGKETGHRFIYTDGDTASGDCNFYNIHPGASEEDKQSTPVLSLRALREHIIEEYDDDIIDYLKVDIEGAEFEFLYNEDLSNIRTIAVEVHGVPGPLVGNVTQDDLISYLIKYFVPVRTGNNMFFGHARQPGIQTDLSALTGAAALTSKKSDAEIIDEIVGWNRAGSPKTTVDEKES